jgi:hypothetical protein
MNRVTAVLVAFLCPAAIGAMHACSDGAALNPQPLPPASGDNSVGSPPPQGAAGGFGDGKTSNSEAAGATNNPGSLDSGVGADADAGPDPDKDAATGDAGVELDAGDAGP